MIAAPGAVPSPPPDMPDATSSAVVAAVAALAGAVNSVAGGGSLLTYPALVALGVGPVAANATSTVALWPGSLASLWGYRSELAGGRTWVAALAAPSVAGGLAGALLLLWGGDAWFARLVPWLVLGATLLFMLQRPLLVLARGGRGAGARPAPPTDAGLPSRPTTTALAFQFLVGIYGGYFGAGAGILTLASLGLLGLTNIHRMNGLKAWTATCFNAVAIGVFVVAGVVDWAHALLMAAGSGVGGYLAARVARRAPQAAVRGLVVVIGLASAVWLAVRR
jgi:uncharacterized membrane protein YfcA